MNQTEIAVTLLSFVYVLALTHILQCLRDLWIARDHVKPAASQLIWMVALMVLGIETWFPAAAADVGAITGWRLAARLLFAMGIYFACAFVSPPVPEKEIVDLQIYEARNGVGYKLTFIFLGAVALPLNYDTLTRGGAEAMSWAEFLPSQWFLGVTTIATAVSIWRQERWVRTLCAVIVLAVNLLGLPSRMGVP
jgi:hypothetical protein